MNMVTELWKNYDSFYRFYFGYYISRLGSSAIGPRNVGNRSPNQGKNQPSGITRVLNYMGYIRAAIMVLVKKNCVTLSYTNTTKPSREEVLCRVTAFL